MVRDNSLTTAVSMNLSLADARREIFRLKTQNQSFQGWSPTIRQRFGHFTPDEWYEALMFRTIDADSTWLDVGCGAELFPSNPNLADILSSRCKLLVGIDPDDNINKNTALHQRQQCLIDEYETSQRFDVISLRMVAEHITDPPKTVAALERLVRNGGRVVIYTVSKWCPASLIAAATPMTIHHRGKQALWGSSPEDAFQTVYKMNTRRKLRNLFQSAGLVEENFYYLNDCRSLGRWKIGLIFELSVERALRGLGLRYPEFCLLGVYRKHS
jgi:SAM-dependent methyltransferase